MKITLISTATIPSDQGIRTIASVLKTKGHDVDIIFMTLSDDYYKNYSTSELSQLAEICKGSELIGINSFASTAKRAARIIKFIKCLNIPLVYGGVHATINPEECIKHSDIVCVGEGEGTIIDLVAALENKKEISKIENLWIRKNGEIIKNPVRNIIDNIDSLPFPDYGIDTHFVLEDGKIRKFHEGDLDGQIFFLTGRGCPYGCDYCSNSLFNDLYKGKRKKILRWHSPEYIVEGILKLKKKFTTLNYFDIRDDTFSFRSLDQIREFCNLYKEKVKMRFKCLGDPKTVTDEKIKLLVDAGCTDFIIGIQGSERTNREIYHRAQSDKNILDAANILAKYREKLAVMYDIITCNPYEGPKDIINLILLLKKIPKPYYLSVNNLVFFPGSKLYKRAYQDRIIKTESDAAYQLNYWDRGTHILLRKKNMYLILILNLMRGAVTKKRYGFIPAPLLQFLINPKRVRKNLRNTFPTIFALQFVIIYDLVRERILKPIFHSLPLGFKAWYDRIRNRV